MDQKNVTHPWPQRLLWLLSFQDQVSGLKTKSEASGQSLKWLKPRDSRVKSQDLRPKTKSHHQGIATQTPALRCALFSTPPWSWSWLQNTAIITITKCPLPPLKKEEWPTFSFVLLEDTYINIVRTEEKKQLMGQNLLEVVCLLRKEWLFQETYIHMQYGIGDFCSTAQSAKIALQP